MSQGQVGNILKFTQQYFLLFSVSYAICLTLLVFSVSFFFGKKTRPLLPRQYDSSSLLHALCFPSLPFPARLPSQGRLPHFFSRGQFGLCQSRVRFGQPACDIPVAFVDRWRLDDAVVMCFSCVAPLRPFFRVQALIPISRSNPKHSGLADDCCGSGGRGSSWVNAGGLWRCCTCL